MNLCPRVVNSQRLFCSPKADVKCWYLTLWYTEVYTTKRYLNHRYKIKIRKFCSQFEAFFKIDFYVYFTNCIFSSKTLTQIINNLILLQGMILSHDIYKNWHIVKQKIFSNRETILFIRTHLTGRPSTLSRLAEILISEKR